MGRSGRVRGRHGGIHAFAKVAGEVRRPPEGDQHLTAFEVGDHRGVERQRHRIEPDALFVGQASYGIVGGPDRPQTGGGGLAVGHQLEPVPGDVGQVLREVGGEVGLRGAGDGAVERGPGGGVERRLDRVPGERMDQAVLADAADPVDQAVGGGLVDERKAPGDGFVEGGGEEGDREVAADDGCRLNQPVAVGRDPVEPRTNHVEHGARRAVRAPRAVRDGAGDLADEQWVPAGDVQDGAGIRRAPAPSEPRQLLAHLGQAEATQVEPLHSRRPQQLRQHAWEGAARSHVAEGGDEEEPCPDDLVGDVAEDEQRRLVGPVDVVEDDDQPAPARRGADGLGHVVEDAEPVLG